MKFIRSLTVFSFSFVYLIASAQIVLRPESSNLGANNEAFQNFIMAAKYNASIVGYGVVCGMNKPDIDKVELIFINQISRARLSQEELNQLNSTYISVKQQIINTPRQGLDCGSFSAEFKKIINFIDS